VIPRACSLARALLLAPGMRARVADTFTESMSRLEGPERAAVKSAAFDYLAGSTRPGHRLHRLVHADDRRFWSLRVNRELRIILYHGHDEVVLCLADHHDRAYAWAAHRVGAPESGREAPLDVARPPPRCEVAAPAGCEHGLPQPRSRPAAARAAPAGSDAPPPPSVAASRRHLRLVRRASAPLPAKVQGSAPWTTPAPLVHLLRFFEEGQLHPLEPAAGEEPAREGAEPADALGGGSAGASPTRSRLRLVAEPGAWAAAAVIVPWLGAAWLCLGPGAAAALALGQAFCAGWLLWAQARRAARQVEEAERDADLAVAALASALESLRRGDAPAVPHALPAGNQQRAWAAIGHLGRFLALHPGDIRVLAERPVGRVLGEGIAAQPATIAGGRTPGALPRSGNQLTRR
jgi:hypothetical protein